MLSVQQNFGFNIQPIVNQLFYFKNRSQLTNKLKPITASSERQISLGSIGIDQCRLEEVFRENRLVPIPYSKKGHIIVFNDGPTKISLKLRKNPILYIQRRGFRSHRLVDKGKQSTEENSLGLFDLKRVFDSFKDNVKTGKSEKFAEEQALEKYTLIKRDTSKFNDSQKATFLDGFAKGLLISHTSANDKKKPFAKLKSTILYLTVAAVIVYSFVTYLFRNSSGKIFTFFPDMKEFKPEETNVTFDDVRGMEEAKLEVEEIVNYLRNPERYSRLGGRLPKGVLLMGSPGTGKTLLARAIAGEADVPFFHASGSEFDEVLVGQGAKRVRDLFARAKASSPCIVFIDEIDSVGAKRTSSSLHPYANQTVNQLLSEMDGFAHNEGIIVIGATNRKEDLDGALLRPGRFDVQVHVSIPDFTGRKDIFKLYLSKIIHENINVTTLAKRTTGFTGADIENMVNQSALKAATEGANRVVMRHLDEARDRILMGPARLRGKLPDEDTNRNTAYHEAGHALVAYFTPGANPLHKVTIIPRGQSLGLTSFIPEKDVYQTTKSQLLAQLDVAMGGRVAEELIFGPEKITTGAASDLQNATKLAKELVKTFGMSDKAGLRDFTSSMESNGIMVVNDLSQQAKESIDQEISRLLLEAYQRAKEILTKHKREHQLLAEALLEYETLDSKEVLAAIKGEKIVKEERPMILPSITKTLPGKRRSTGGMGGIQVQITKE